MENALEREIDDELEKDDDIEPGIRSALMEYKKYLNALG